MNIHRIFGLWAIGFFLIIGFASAGCTKTTKILASQSNVSNAEAVADLQEQINNAEKEDCEPIAFSSGVGVGRATGVGLGFVIPGDCKDCDELKGQQEKVIEKEERVFVANALMRC